MVVSVSEVLLVIVPALMPVASEVLTFTLPAPFVLWLTVIVLSSMVLVVPFGRVVLTEYLVSAPPFIDTQ